MVSGGDSIDVTPGVLLQVGERTHMSIVSGTNSSDWCQKKHAKRALSLDDRYRMASLRAHCLAICLDRKLFRPMIERLRALRESEALQMEPIKADAPSEMMRRCFGLGGREYTRLRRMLVASPAIGRPPEPDEDTAHRLWRELAPQLEASGPGGPGPESYLAVHRRSGAPLRDVWNVAQRWLEHGDAHGPDGSGYGRPLPPCREAGEARGADA